MGNCENTELNIKWPENDKGTLLCDVFVEKGFDGLFLTMQGGLNSFRVRLFIYQFVEISGLWIIMWDTCAEKY